VGLFKSERLKAGTETVLTSKSLLMTKPISLSDFSDFWSFGLSDFLQCFFYHIKICMDNAIFAGQIFLK